MNNHLPRYYRAQGNSLNALRTGRDGSTCWARSSHPWALYSRSRRLKAPASAADTPFDFVAENYGADNGV